jgi:hypothetical protein
MGNKELFFYLKDSKIRNKPKSKVHIIFELFYGEFGGNTNGTKFLLFQVRKSNYEDSYGK